MSGVRVEVPDPENVLGSKIARSVMNLLAVTPARFLSGLDCILVLDSESLSRRERLRLRRRPNDFVLGSYFPRNRRRPPRIEIYSDGLMRSRLASHLSLPAFREVFVARVLFHELGHHVSSMIEPTHASREAVAERWAKKLARQALMARFPTLHPLLGTLMRRGS